MSERLDLKELKRLDLKGLAEYIGKRVDSGEPFTQSERVDLHDVLGDQIAWAGNLWDWADGTDPNRGNRATHGTPNHHSMTYKCRKLAGYSYP
jgi:hypothetical protein